MEPQRKFSQIRKRGNVRALLHVTPNGREGESVMNREEVNWLLQTIKDPGDTKRFLLAQYERGRISLQLMNEVAPERDCINGTTTPLLTTETERLSVRSAMALVFATAW
jgi:hypothetical protein